MALIIKTKGFLHYQGTRFKFINKKSCFIYFNLPNKRDLVLCDYFNIWLWENNDHIYTHTQTHTHTHTHAHKYKFSLFRKCYRFYETILHKIQKMPRWFLYGIYIIIWPSLQKRIYQSFRFNCRETAHGTDPAYPVWFMGVGCCLHWAD